MENEEEVENVEEVSWKWRIRNELVTGVFNTDVALLNPQNCRHRIFGRWTISNFLFYHKNRAKSSIWIYSFFGSMTTMRATSRRNIDTKSMVIQGHFKFKK